MLKTAPAVFAVGNSYQIMAQTIPNAFFSVIIGDRIYHDAANGVARSQSELHRVTVPMAALDTAGSYTVIVRPLVERIPYFTQTHPAGEFSFRFRPVPAENMRIYHISDAHNRIEQPVTAARAYGKIDALILNGDVIDHSGDIRNFDNVYQICAALTGGEIPVIFARGNHDMRGAQAEKFAEYTPNHQGNTYYSFRLGNIWGVILDCGEDKPDEHPAYGGTAACHAFRLQQTQYLKQLIEYASREYEAEGVKTRLVIVHMPFSERNVPPFDIEEEIYREWCSLLREQIRPHLMLCGHTHAAEIRYPGHQRDTYGQSCPVVIASAFDSNSGYWTGCGFEFHDGEVSATYTDSDGKVLSVHQIPLK